jgi:hypothetical protein
MVGAANNVAQIIAAKLARGALRRDRYDKLWARPGNGNMCEGCDLAILHTEVEFGVIFHDYAILRFHSECFMAWDRLRQPDPS